MLTQTILEFILFYNIYLTEPVFILLGSGSWNTKKNRSCKICFIYIHIYIVAKNTQGKNQHIYANASQVSNMMFLMFMFFFVFYAPFQTISIIKWNYNQTLSEPFPIPKYNFPTTHTYTHTNEIKEKHRELKLQLKWNKRRKCMEV